MAGVPLDQRKAVQAGVVSLDEARAEKLKAKARKEVEAIPLDSKANVLAFLGRCAGELVDGSFEANQASAAAALARTALAALDISEETPPDAEVVGFTVEIVDRNTKVN